MTSNKSELNILMHKVIKAQNLDGSFGSNNQSVFTSYYLIAMVLDNKVTEPFKFSIKRALAYLIGIKDNSAESYIALKLIRDRSTFNKKELMSIITYRENKDKLGNLIYIYRMLLDDVKSFSKILFNDPLEKHELIYYLFNEIINA